MTQPGLCKSIICGDDYDDKEVVSTWHVTSDQCSVEKNDDDDDHAAAADGDDDDDDDADDDVDDDDDDDKEEYGY